MIVSLVAALGRDRAIGRAGGLLWHESADQKFFRQVTMGCPVLMGRRTWASLPERFRPLPGRRNLVLTRDPRFDAPGAETATSLDEALQRVAGAPRVCVIGGGELYAAAIARGDELVLTEIDAEFPDADTFFPHWDRAAFEEVSREPHVSAQGVAYAFVVYRRRASA